MAEAGYSAEYLHLLGKARDAKRSGDGAWHVMSTGEKLAVALTLNRPDLLKEMGYTIAEAIHRVGMEWVSFMPDIERRVDDEFRHDE